MKTKKKNLSEFDNIDSLNASDMKFGIVVSEWNKTITDALFSGAYQTLLKFHTKPENIIKKEVPGTFELTLGAQMMAEYTDVDGVIVLGCVIQGETRHFDFICQSVTQGITQLNIKYNMPIIFGVLTTENIQQAMDRAGGKHGNKGDEAAITAIKMIQLQNNFESGFINEYNDFQSDDNE